MSLVSVLNVDDYAAARYVKTRLLQNAGFCVHEARNGREALQLVKVTPPGLVLLDVRLPDIDGLEVCRQIKLNPATWSWLVVHISSAFITPADVNNGYSSGADAYITAPYAPASLVELIKLLTTNVQVKPIDDRNAGLV